MIVIDRWMMIEQLSVPLNHIGFAKDNVNDSISFVSLNGDMKMLHWKCENVTLEMLR